MKKLFRRLFPDKELRAYRKMHRRHRKELIKHAKETAEFEWGYLHDSIIMQIRHMYEYYTAGNNVWQTDETRLPIIEQLKHVLGLQDELDNLWETDTTDVKVLHKREEELYAEIYSYIGKYIQWWWD